MTTEITPDCCRVELVFGDTGDPATVYSVRLPDEAPEEFREIAKGWFEENKTKEWPILDAEISLARCFSDRSWGYDKHIRSMEEERPVTELSFKKISVCNRS